MKDLNNNYNEQFMVAAKAQDNSKMSEILKIAWNENPNSEAVHNIAFNISFYELPYYNFLQIYLEKFPVQIHPGYIILGAFYANEGRNDEATVSARTFLANFRKLKSDQALETQTFIPHQLGRAFLIATTAYTHAGARGYSLRLLNKALSMAISPVMRGHIENEIKTLKTELEDSTHQKINQKWEKFFSNANHFQELYDLCIAKNLPVLAKRTELIEGRFRFNLNYRFDEDVDELFEEVLFLTEKNSGKEVALLA